MIFRFSICGLAVLLAIASTSFGQEETGLAKQEWEQLKPTGARASIEMPIKPRYVERSFAPIQDKPPVKVRLHLATVSEGLATFIFGYHDLHEKPSDQQAANALDGAVRGAVGNVMGQLLDTPKRITYNKYPGRQFGYQFIQNEQRFTVLSRVYLINKRQYQLNVVMDVDVYDESLASKFLNSFKYLEPENDIPPRPRDSK